MVTEHLVIFICTHRHMTRLEMYQYVYSFLFNRNGFLLLPVMSSCKWISHKMLNHVFSLLHAVCSLHDCQVDYIHMHLFKKYSRCSSLWTIQDEMNWSLTVILCLPIVVFNTLWVFWSRVLCHIIKAEALELVTNQGENKSIHFLKMKKYDVSIQEENMYMAK